MAVLPVGAVGDNLRCFQSVFMFVSSANACFRVGDLFDVFAHSYASHTWPNDLFSPAHGSNSETSAIHSTAAIQSTAADKLTLVQYRLRAQAWCAKRKNVGANQRPCNRRSPRWVQTHNSATCARRRCCLEHPVRQRARNKKVMYCNIQRGTAPAST